ncbi:phosphotransferase family protein [Amycolatopsis samaneae]|uniref:Phosphotransferase family protein n=1 Tax=Amycolatopsis samaneae TaxID=664691 RepID=A0ABW5G7F8_9PSEU
MPSALDDAVAAWIGTVLPGRRVARTRTLRGGFRNHNVHLVTDDGGQYVLRRVAQRDTCGIEAALATRLAGIAPVPEVVAVDPDGTEAGQPVLLSRFVSGVLLSEALPTADAECLGRAVGAVLAAIGTVVFPRPGFFTGADLVPDGTEPTADLPAFVERCLRAVDANRELGRAERDALLRHAEHRVPLVETVRGSRALVHSDFNPKNLLVARDGDGWVVSAVLDWEFAFAGSPLFDVGNMLRFPEDHPPAFRNGFTRGFAEAGGELPDDWPELGRALDLFALADFLTRPADHPFFGRAVALLRQRLRD